MFVGTSISLSSPISEPLPIFQVIYGWIEYSDGSWVPSGVSVTIIDLNNSNSMVRILRFMQSIIERYQVLQQLLGL